ncbi:MAG: hypothetical protein FWG10_12355 [Eubacteriaceae bacterium]|nr:hypothetical protein [Eubacteriaceae bacterium]
MISAHFGFFKKLKAKEKAILIASLVLFAALAYSMVDTSGKTAKKTASTPQSNATEYRKSVEADLKAILESIAGVGKVEVMITVDGEIRDEILYNETNSSTASTDPSSRSSEQSSSMKEAVMSKRGSDTVPYSPAKTYPKVIGVVVSAEGANDATIRMYILDAVKSLLDVPAHRISVLPKTKKN